MVDYGVLAQLQVQKQWPKFGSIRKRCLYRSVVNPVYDEDTQTATPQSDADTQTIYVIFDKYSDTIQTQPWGEDDETPGVYKDKKAMFPALDLPFEPKENDIIENQENGDVWRVIGGSDDPVPALYELHVRSVA